MSLASNPLPGLNSIYSGSVWRRLPGLHCGLLQRTPSNSISQRGYEIFLLLATRGDSSGDSACSDGKPGGRDLQCGDKLEALPQDDGAILLQPATVDIAELCGLLPQPERAVSLEKIKSAIEQGANE